jgi:hypothetical protein
LHSHKCGGKYQIAEFEVNNVDLQDEDGGEHGTKHGGGDEESHSDRGPQGDGGINNGVIEEIISPAAYVTHLDVQL